MHTIRLRIHDKVYDKFMWLLKRFSADEVEIIPEDAAFQETRDYLAAELEEIKNGRAAFLTPDQADELLDKIISKYEDPA
jgi:hypothetical protein